MVFYRSKIKLNQRYRRGEKALGEDGIKYFINLKKRHVEICAFDERMDPGLRLEKWDLMCNLLVATRRKFILFRTPKNEMK